jgi:hypothetical protein
MLFSLLLAFSSFLELEHAAKTACNEAGTDYLEGAMVLQVAVNRSKLNNTSLDYELTKPNQFNPFKKCPSIALAHYVLAILAYSDALPTPSIVKHTNTTHYDSQWSQSRISTKCDSMYTVGELWEYWGYKIVYRSKANHLFFKATKNNPGCPSNNYKSTKQYLAFRNSNVKPNTRFVNTNTTTVTHRLPGNSHRANKLYK